MLWISTIETESPAWGGGLKIVGASGAADVETGVTFGDLYTPEMSNWNLKKNKKGGPDEDEDEDEDADADGGGDDDDADGGGDDDDGLGMDI